MYILYVYFIKEFTGCHLKLIIYGTMHKLTIKTYIIYQRNTRVALRIESKHMIGHGAGLQLSRGTRVRSGMEC